MRKGTREERGEDAGDEEEEEDEASSSFENHEESDHRPSSPSESSSDDEEEDEEDDEQVVALKPVRRRGRPSAQKKARQAGASVRVVAPSATLAMTPGVLARLKDVPRPRKPPTWIHPAYTSDAVVAKMARKLAKHERKKREYDLKVLEAMDEERIPIEDRADVYVKLECELKGVHSAGPRTLVLDRLEAFNRGEKVLMNELFQYKPVSATDLTQLLVAKPPPRPINQRATGQDGLEGVPSDVIVVHLFPFLMLRSMFRLAYTCKRLFALVMPVLRTRAKALFGEGGTPMALSCALEMDKTDRSEVIARAKELFKTMCLPIPSRAQEDSISKTLSMRAAAVGKGFRVIVNDMTNFVAVQLAIDRYGTIEGLVAQRAKNAAAEKLRAQERDSMINQGPQRLKELNDALSEAGYPVVFDRMVPQETAAQRRERARREKEADKLRYGDAYKTSKRVRQLIKFAKDDAETPGRDRLALTVRGMIIMLHLDNLCNGPQMRFDMCLHRRTFLTKSASFVFRHSPKQTRTLLAHLQDLGDTFPAFVSRLPDTTLYETNARLAVKCFESLFGFSGPFCRVGGDGKRMYKTPFMLTCGVDMSKNPRLDRLLGWIMHNYTGDWTTQKGLLDLADGVLTGASVAIVWGSLKRMPYFEMLDHKNDALENACKIVARETADVNTYDVKTYLWGDTWALAQLLYPAAAAAKRFGPGDWPLEERVLRKSTMRDCTIHCLRDVLVFFVDDTKKK